MRNCAIAIVLLAANVCAQTPARDADALRDLLAEVRQLRQDIEAMTVASQRVQIALHGLQMQDAAVARASQRLDEARTKRLGMDSNRDRLAEEVRKWEATLASGTLKDNDAKAVQERLIQLKSELERATVMAQSQQAAEAEASSLFRTEQAKLTEIQDRIERLDKVLEKLGTPAAKPAAR